MIVNFYNKIKKEVKLDFKEFLCDICFDIFCSLGLADYYITTKKRYNRKNKKETTKYIVEEATDKLYEHPKFLNEFLYLEYKNKFLNPIHSVQVNGESVGFVDGGEIFLKLNEGYIKTCSLERNIRLTFKDGGSDRSITIKRNCLVSEVLKRFLLESGYNNESQLEFIYNGVKLGFNNTNTLEEIGIRNNSYILVSPTNLIHGGGVIGFMDFVDVKSRKVKKLEFNPHAPKWRLVSNGLNIFGFCKNSKCKAFKEEVVYPFEGFYYCRYKFDLKKEVTNIKCPICNRIFKAETCGFYKCEYQFSGKIIVEGEIKDYTSEPKETKNNEFEYFDPYKNGKQEWLELIIYILPKQEIKYKKN